MEELSPTYDLPMIKPDGLGKEWSLKRLTPITVFFGKNGSGKSILLRKIRDIDSTRYHYCAPERGGNINHQYSYMQDETNGGGRAGASQHNLATDYRQRVITRIAVYLSQRGAFRGQITDDSLTKIEKFMQEMLIDFRFQFQTDIPNFHLERIETKQIITDIAYLSSGEVQLLTLSLDLLLVCEMWTLEGKKGTLLVDEPDTHLHPDMQQRFAKFLVELNREYDCSIIVATHSTTLLSALGQYGGLKTSVIYVTERNEIHAIPFDKYHRTLSTCLGGHALMGPLFNAPILLVEGDDDYRIWSEIPRHSLLNLAVIPCNGNEIYEYQKVLEALFTSILNTSEKITGYALLDGDKIKPTGNQNHIKFLKLSCRESENLYLTDEVLTMLNYSWETACDKIAIESVKYGQKSNELRNISSRDRKNDDYKNIINQIAEILDDKKLPWSYRLGKILGEKRPEGQLQDFLGTEIVESLWS